MEKQLFFLENYDKSGIIRILRIILGIICLVLAGVWIYFTLANSGSQNSVWLTIIFLIFFGTYQVLAGSGKTIRFIEIENEKITIKQNSFLPKTEIIASELKGIVIFPLSISFTKSDGSALKLRFGVSYPEIIVPVKEALSEFATLHNITLESKDEISEEAK